MELSLQLPINSVSMGQVSTAILRECYQRGYEPSIFPIGEVDLSTQDADEGFRQWLTVCINNRLKKHQRSTPLVKIWHLNGGLETVSHKQILWSFYELDAPTAEENNAVRNNHKVVFNSRYAVEQFGTHSNVEFVPLAFDSHGFKVTPPKKVDPTRVTFTLLGKLEKRKNHAKVIRAWAKQFGNNPNYFLNCAIYNPFLRRVVNGQVVDENLRLIQQILGGQRYFNIQFMEFMGSNQVYNEFLNNSDVAIGMSGGECWDLPVFQSVALGKHSVILNATAYKDWANAANSVLVEPCGKIDAYDNVFFQKGAQFNQGRIFDFDEADFIQGCKQAIQRVTASRTNLPGLALQSEFTYAKTLDKVLALI